jgi:glycosyltransferase involved in cell wall biosynthesis
MKIALIDPSLFTWPYDLRLAKGLTEIGHSVQIFGREPGYELPVGDSKFLARHFYAGLQNQAFKRLAPSVQLALKGVSHISSMVRLLKQLRQTQPDIIHFQWTPLATIDQHFLPFFRKIAPTIITVHDSNPFNNNPRSRLQRLGAIEIFHKFDHLLVHTRSAYARVESYGVPKEKLSIVAHGLLTDASEFSRVSAPADRGRVVILLFGQVKPYKGVDVLLRAMSRLPPGVKDCCLVRIVGRPEMPMDPLFALVDELGLKEQVEFDLRFIPDAEIPSLLTSSDILVFPYREIDASGVLMLALAAGRPVVASRIGIFAEWLGDLGPGILVEPDSPDALASALSPLTSDPDYRDSIASKMLRLRDSVPAWREIALVTEGIYQRELLRAGKKGRAMEKDRSN